MKYRDIVLGTRATTTIPFPTVRDPSSEAEPKPVLVSLRMLNVDEGAEVLSKAPAFAIARGAKDPKAGDELYELGRQVYTVFLSCVDPDDPEPESPGARFFSSVDEILQDKSLGRDAIAYLYEAQCAWQAHCSPRKDNQTQDFWKEVVELARSNDPLEFVALQPVSQWIFARSMAAMLWHLQTNRSSSGSPTETPGTSSPKKTPDVAEAPES